MVVFSFCRWHKFRNQSLVFCNLLSLYALKALYTDVCCLGIRSVSSHLVAKIHFSVVQAKSLGKHKTTISDCEYHN